MEVLSPMPGIFYRRPSPDAPCYVEEGQAVKAGDVLGLIEVMKQYSELTSEADGVISAILVEDGDAVEAGQTILTME